MRVTWHARIREGAISFLALVALVSLLYAADFRVREQAMRIVAATTPSNIAQDSAQVTADASQMVANVREQAMQHIPMATFLTTAGVLLLFMLKT